MSVSSPGTGILKVNENTENGIKIQLVLKHVDILAAGTGHYVNVDVPELDGYVPILGMYRTNSAHSNILPYLCVAEPQGNIIQLGITNVGNRDYSNFNVYVYILYQKKKGEQNE